MKRDLYTNKKRPVCKWKETRCDSQRDPVWRCESQGRGSPLGLFSFVYRSLFICAQVSFHLYAGLFSFVGRSLFICIQSLFICIQVSFYLYTGLFSFVYRSLFVCIQVSFHLYTGLLCSSLVFVHRRPVHKWKETCIQMKRDLYTNEKRPPLGQWRLLAG